MKTVKKIGSPRGPKRKTTKKKLIMQLSTKFKVIEENPPD
jgi:hypothetical protein